MYVCVCRAVTDRDITEAAQRGISSIEELSNVTGVGTDCGACQQRACQMLSAIANPTGSRPMT